MKFENICWLEDWQIRYPHPQVEYGTKRPEVVGVFLAITERKNCTLRLDHRENVSLVGNVFNYPDGEFDDGFPVMSGNVVKIEHKLLTEGVERRMKAIRNSFGKRLNLDRKEKEFATLVTTADGLTYMLGYIGQRLSASANPLNWDMLQGSRGYSPDAYERKGNMRHFEEFAGYFEDINIDYKPLDLEG